MEKEKDALSLSSCFFSSPPSVLISQNEKKNAQLVRARWLMAIYAKVLRAKKTWERATPYFTAIFITCRSFIIVGCLLSLLYYSTFRRTINFLRGPCIVAVRVPWPSRIVFAKKKLRFLKISTRGWNLISIWGKIEFVLIIDFIWFREFSGWLGLRWRWLVLLEWLSSKTSIPW